MLTQTCIALLILATPYREPTTTVSTVACYSDALSSDTGTDTTRGAQCERLAARTIRYLQWKGVLPGAHEVISYRMGYCTTIT